MKNVIASTCRLKRNCGLQDRSLGILQSEENKEIKIKKKQKPISTTEHDLKKEYHHILGILEEEGDAKILFKNIMENFQNLGRDMAILV